MGLFSTISYAVKSTAYMRNVLKHIDATTRPGTSSFICSQPGMQDAIIAITNGFYKDGESVENCAEAICQTFCNLIGI
jgi:hypothetical protein